MSKGLRVWRLSYRKISVYLIEWNEAGKKVLYFFNRACFGEFLLPTTLFLNNSDWNMNLKSGSTKLKGTRYFIWKQILVTLLGFCVLCMQMDKHRKAGTNWEAPRRKWKQLKTQMFIFFLWGVKINCASREEHWWTFEVRTPFYDKISSPTG